jgi:23S rRNA (uracil1939-C5)-methyltransferase
MLMSAPSFEIVPQKLVYGGAALGYHEGRPVFVRGALPDERVEVQPTREAKGMVHGRVLKVITPSALRVAAPCPHFGRCGGCHYQHLDPERQLEVKREILRETLRRIGGIDWRGEIAVHAASAWRYRNQAQLKIGRLDESETAIGFFEADSHRLVRIDECPILSPKLNAILAELSRPEWRPRLAGFAEIDLFADHRDQEVMLTLRGRGEVSQQVAQDWLTLLPGVTTVAFESDERPLRQAQASARSPQQPKHSTDRNVFGASRMRYQVGKFNYEISPGSFFQASRLLLPDLVAAVVGSVSGSLALDLYAGVGLFTLPLAERFREVIAVEASPAAAADLDRNLKTAGFTNARAVRAKTADFLRRYAGSAPELAVLDPPRAGADAQTLRFLQQLAPAQICYVSCQPPTFGRDLAFLTRHGYRLESVDMFDLFPQTFHIESLAKLRQS